MNTILCQDIIQLICEFGWGVEKCKLTTEIALLIQFRNAVPPSCVKPLLSWHDSRYGDILNPWYRGMPYTPLCLIRHETPYVDLSDICNSISRYLFRNMHTYWGVFRRHCQCVAHGSPLAWNKFILSIWAIVDELDEVGPLVNPPLNRMQLILLQAETAELLPGYFLQPWHEPVISCS